MIIGAVSGCKVATGGVMGILETQVKPQK